MAFKEPVGAYFAHHRDVALHLDSGAMIVGYLDLESIDINGTDLAPDISIEQQPYFECPRKRWDEVGVIAEDQLKIDGGYWIVEDEPRDRVIARVKLRRVYPDE